MTHSRSPSSDIEDGVGCLTATGDAHQRGRQTRQLPFSGQLRDVPRGEMQPFRASGDLAVAEGRDVRPHRLDLAQEDVRADRPDPGELGEPVAEPGRVPAGLGVQAAQVAAPGVVASTSN
jgi:hypothetical protein